MPYLGNCMNITVSTQSYGTEVSWTLTDETGSFCAGSEYSDGLSNTSTTCCLNFGRYVVSCMDSYGDGWNGAVISIDGANYCDDFIWGHKWTANVGRQRANTVDMCCVGTCGRFSIGSWSNLPISLFCIRPRALRCVSVGPFCRRLPRLIRQRHGR
jgi:hypothetical protein